MTSTQKYNHRLTRREFFVKHTPGVPATGLLGKNLDKPVPPESSGFISRPGREVTLICRTLGRTGIRLPIVNLGVMNSTDADLIKRSYERGVRLFYTAAYNRCSQNEIVVGKAIRDLGVRDKVIIGASIHVPHEQRQEMPPAALKKVSLDTAEESLRRLRTEVLDIVYLDNVQGLECMNNPGIMEALRTLKESAKVRHLGLSIHTNMTALVLDACRSGFYEVLAIPYNCALADNLGLSAALKLACAEGIGLIAIETQCMQYWHRENVLNESRPYYEGTILQTTVLKWALRREFITCAVPGCANFEQMEENFSVASNLEYTAKERRFLEDRAFKMALLRYCRQCGSCRSTCPNKVDVPALMRAHLYAVCYANYDQARVTIQGISNGRGLMACASCKACSARCHRRVPIERRLQELRMIYG